MRLGLPRHNAAKVRSLGDRHGRRRVSRVNCPRSGVLAGSEPRNATELRHRTNQLPMARRKTSLMPL